MAANQGGPEGAAGRPLAMLCKEQAMGWVWETARYGAVAGWQETRGVLSVLGLTFSGPLLQAGIVRLLEAPGCTEGDRHRDAACSVTAGDARRCT